MRTFNILWVLDSDAEDTTSLLEVVNYHVGIVIVSLRVNKRPSLVLQGNWLTERHLHLLVLGPV